MPGSASDAVITVRRLCRHGIEFRLGVQLRASSGQKESSDALGRRYVRIQAASPPPTRGGAPWEDGIFLKDSGQPLRPTELGPTDRDARLKRGVEWLSGIPSLDQPKPTLEQPKPITLDRWLAVPDKTVEPYKTGESDKAEEPAEREPQAKPRPFNLAEEDKIGFQSVPYKPAVVSRDGKEVNADYSGEYCRDWDRPLDPGDWVAISFDRFSPPERDSADYIAQVGECSQGNCIRHQSPNDPDQAA